MTGAVIYHGPSLLDRLAAKIQVSDDPGACWLWTGGTSRGQGREVEYGIIREGGGGSRLWRVNRLVLILTDGHSYVPMQEGEEFIEWLHRANRWFLGEGWESSHQCDVSLCARPDHLHWRTHPDNVRDGAERRRGRDRRVGQRRRG